MKHNLMFERAAASWLVNKRWEGSREGFWREVGVMEQRIRNLIMGGQVGYAKWRGLYWVDVEELKCHPSL